MTIKKFDFKTGKVTEREETQSEKKAHIAAMKADEDSKSYVQKRLSEYPSVGDQLDAIWKELNYRRLNGETLTQESDNILNKILAVKSKHPKK